MITSGQIQIGDDQRPWPVEAQSSWRDFIFLVQQAALVAVDLVFPPHCIGCDRVGSLLCQHCLASILPAEDRVVDGCDEVRACARYEGTIRLAIHALKYKRQVRLADPLGKLVAEMIRDETWPVDLVTSVPLHATRLQERGYNQAGLLGLCVTRMNGWRFDPGALRRARATESQVNLTMRERQVNVAGAFVADPTIVRGQRVLVIDDVLTTGATLGACAEALRAAGADQVFGAAVAGAVYSEVSTSLA